MPLRTARVFLGCWAAIGQIHAKQILESDYTNKNAGFVPLKSLEQTQNNRKMHVEHAWNIVQHKNTKNVQNELQNPNPVSVALLCFTLDSSIGEASSSTLRDFRSLRHPDVD